MCRPGVEAALLATSSVYTARAYGCSGAHLGVIFAVTQDDFRSHVDRCPDASFGTGSSSHASSSQSRRS